MNRSLQSLVRLCLAGMSGVFLLDPVIAMQPRDERLERIFADWQKRHESIKSIYYRLEGERIFPKGSFTNRRRTRLNPAQPPQPPEPTHDLAAPLRWSLLLDFPSNRHRLEVDEKYYDGATNQFYPKVWTNMYDGSTLRGSDPREANTSASHTPAPTEPDVGIFTGELKAAAFEPKYWPCFAGVGIIVPSGEMIYPGRLSPVIDRELFYVQGLGVQAGRSCLVLRSHNVNSDRNSAPYIEYWVDPGRDSAILRIVQGVNKNIFTDSDIRYQKTPEGWFPQNWTFILHSSGSNIVYLERLRVKELKVNPQVSDADFQVDIQPGMLLRKTLLGSPKTGEPIIVAQEQRNYRVGKNGELIEVFFSGGWHFWRWGWTAIGILLILALWFRFWRKKTRVDAQS